MQPSQPAAPSDDLDELARFRAEWKAEVLRKRGQSAPVPQELALGPSPKNDTSLDVQSSTSIAPLRPTATRLPSNVALKAPTNTSSAPLGKNLSRAVEVYRRAVQCEQQSNLDEALQLYRTAFRMDSNVDRAYHKVEGQLQPAAITPPSASKYPIRSATPGSGTGAVEEVVRAVKAMDIHSVVVPTADSTAPTGTLASLLTSWPRGLSFEPEDEGQPVPLQRLPDEVLILILRCLDTGTLERFASINRKARLLTLDMSIWRDFVQAMYKPPQLLDDEDLNALFNHYMADYRRLYIERPRVRLDGIYIAVCHYIRAGLSENAWANVSHLVTYHRYLRFYPNGQVLSLLANEELPPQQIIPVLKPTLRMKGLFIGNWQLSDTTVHITSLLDPHSSGGSSARYSFQMTLELRSRPLGRWNRLDFLAYDSVEIESGEATPVALKHERPFWFSKVRSYT